jgi:uncharacterized membrane protein
MDTITLISVGFFVVLLGMTICVVETYANENREIMKRYRTIPTRKC